MTRLRRATAKDGPAIRRMILRERLDPTSIYWQNFLVAEEDGQIVGIGQVKPLRGCRELGSLVVLPAYRSRGIAARLISALEAEAGLPLYLLCRDRMEPYYRRFGFRRISFFAAPVALKLKLLPVLPFRLFGLRVIVMVKEQESAT